MGGERELREKDEKRRMMTLRTEVIGRETRRDERSMRKAGRWSFKKRRRRERRYYRKDGKWMKRNGGQAKKKTIWGRRG